jgi:hypothetical protein
MMADHFRTFSEIFRCGADGAPAILASARPPLTYGGLRALAETPAESLNALGVGRNDRVAIVPKIVAMRIGAGAIGGRGGAKLAAHGDALPKA